MKIAVTGGSGFVGSGLVEVLLNRGDAVLVVTRSRSSLPVPFHGLVDLATWDELDLSGIDGVVHLAGENLFHRRWGSAQKQRIRESRVGGTKRVIEAIARARPRPRVLVSGSAVGYYGPDRGDAELGESAPAAGDYLAMVCRDWELAAAEARELGCRVVPVRIGVVLGRDGGALSRMLPIFLMYVGGPVGSGRQWVSWIHRKDLSRLVVFALEHESLDEPLNGTAPNPVRMRELCRDLGRALRRPSWLPAPGFALRLTLGEVADVILTGQRVVPAKARELGFEFEYPNLEKALDDILLEEVVP